MKTKSEPKLSIRETNSHVVLALATGASVRLTDAEVESLVNVLTTWLMDGPQSNAEAA